MALAALAATLLIGHVRADDRAPQLPVLGDASSGVVTPAVERELARAALRQIRAGAPTVNDPVLKYYVRVHLQRLAEHAGLEEPVLATVLIDSPRINAFAVPGGVVGVNLGLLLHARDESEYSAVVAHELAHLGQRHYARRLEAQRALGPWRLAGLLTALAIGAAGDGDAGMAAAHGAEAFLERRALHFSRGHEQEADRVGCNTLRRAGFDPAGMARMFRRMRQAYRYTAKPPEYLLTHPLTEKRIADAANQCQGAATATSSLDYAFMRARAQLFYAESPSRGMAEARARRGGGAADDYAMVVALAKAGRYDEAAAMLGPLSAKHPASLLLTATYADVLTKAQRLDEALALLERHLAINPENEPLTYLQAKALRAADRPAEAAAVLWRHTRASADDPDVWVLLADAAGLAGDTIGVHRARAEYFALVGYHDKAINHLDYARRLLGADDVRLRAGIDQRIVDLRSEFEALDGERNQDGSGVAERSRGDPAGREPSSSAAFAATIETTRDEPEARAR